MLRIEPRTPLPIPNQQTPSGEHAAKTIQVGVPQDPVCSDGLSLAAHRT